MAQYTYGFEIESILKQFFALIDKSIVLRYEKVENERRLVQTITPFYKFATKSRVLLMLLNGAKNFALPCVVVQVTGISADKDRLAAKNNMISRYNNGLTQGYKRPTPITISVTVNIITKYKTDLFQIYGKLCSQFQPQCFISWMVPTNSGIKGVEELRNKVQWDLNIDIDSKQSLKEQEQDRFTGKMSFKIQGWMFHNPRQCQGASILDIGTTTLVSNELENRIDGMIDHAAPLTSKYGSVYKNPRQWATSHIRILKGYVTTKLGGKDYYFRISDGKYNDYKLNAMDEDPISGVAKPRQYNLVFDGYNMSRANALLVPKKSFKGKQQTINYNDLPNSKVSPKIGQSQQKPLSIKGIPLQVLYQDNNTLKVKLPHLSYDGNFDIIVYDEIDYDTFYNAEGFYLNANK